MGGVTGAAGGGRGESAASTLLRLHAADTHRVATVDQLVHATGAQRRAHRLHHGLARVDVADQLAHTLARVRAVAQQDNLGALWRQWGASKAQSRRHVSGARTQESRGN